MPLTRQPTARKSARKSTTAAKPHGTPLPPDASALLRAIESSADTAAHYVPARYLCMLLLVSKTMRAVLQKARLPASVQTSETTSAESIVQGLGNLSKLCTITEVYFSPGRQFAQMPASMAKALKPQQLTVLCLACANMRNPATRHLATVVEGCENLQRLDISKTYLGDGLMKELAPALGKSTTLQSLDVTWCYLGKDGADWLPGIFQPALRIVKLSHNWLNCASAEVLAKGLGNCLGISELYLNSNNIKAPGAASLAKALAHCQDLSTLDLSYNELGSQGAESMAGGLRGCARLIHLDFSNIHSGTGGLYALRGLLEHCTALLHLGLRGNNKDLDSQVDAAGVSGQSAHLMHLDFAGSPFAAAMFQQDMADHAPTLVHLDLERTSMGFSGAFALAMALYRCGKLEHLNLSYNDQLRDNGVCALAASIGYCTALRELYLGSCYVEPGGCAALAEGLKQCTALTTLNLQYNKIGAAGACSLAEALPNYAALANLNLSGNTIRNRKTTITTIASVLPRCPALVHLHLVDCELRAARRAQLLAAAVACPKLSLHL